MKYKLKIGIETHIRLATKNKLFSPQKINKDDISNSHVDMLDVGYPGVLPIINIDAIDKAIALASNLNMEISDSIIFDRKNYFYPDMPKGYQITQTTCPIGKEGFVILNNNKTLYIKQIHIEEDAAKMTINADNTVNIDYNKSGVPLVEIVTYPQFDSIDQVIEYLKYIWRVVRCSGISQGSMQDGHFKSDINISLIFEDGSFTERVEVKNLNSFNFIKKAIEFEEKRALSGNVLRETRGFCDKTFTTYSLRKKETAEDYRFHVEHNIPTIQLTKEYKTKKAKMYNIPLYLCRSFTNQLSSKEYDYLVDKVYRWGNTYIHLLKFFDQKTSYKWSCIYLPKITKEIDKKSLVYTINQVLSNKIDKGSAIKAMTLYAEDNYVKDIRQYLTIKEDFDYNKIVQNIVKDHPEALQKYKKGNKKALSFLIMQIKNKYPKINLSNVKKQIDLL